MNLRVTTWCSGCALAAMLAGASASAQADARPDVQSDDRPNVQVGDRPDAQTDVQPDAQADARTDAPPAGATCANGSVEVDSLRDALARNAQSPDTRLELADALLAQACYAEAVHVLEEGERLHPRNGKIQSALRDARSMLSEQHYFDALARAERSAKSERNVLRCRKLGDIAACDAALREKPDDGALLIGKADALVRSGQPSEALLLYRQAAGLSGTPPDIEEKIAAAESQRQTLVAQCNGDSVDVALRACQLALLPGAGDEFALQRRRGILLQGMGQPSQALDAYIAASLLKSDDEAVSQAVVALTDSTGRKESVALVARGNALLTLKRGAEAVQAFKEAEASLPGLPGVEASLAAAEELARNEVQRSAAATAAATAKGTAAVTAPAVARVTTPATAAATAPGTARVTTPGISAAAEPGAAAGTTPATAAATSPATDAVTAARSAEPSAALPATSNARESRAGQAASPPAAQAVDSMLAMEAKRTYSNTDPATRSH
jgi:tetratricopeptide (TPR) repeat protein